MKSVRIIPVTDEAHALRSVARILNMGSKDTQNFAIDEDQDDVIIEYSEEADSITWFVEGFVRDADGQITVVNLDC